MAKTRSGLGRGLGSLLGVEDEGSLSQEAAPPVERVSVETKKPAPAVPEFKGKVEEPKQEEPAQAEQETSEDLESEEVVYSNTEDNITIKGVVEREARSSANRSGLVDGDRRIDIVDIDSIEPNPDQPRTNFKREELEELSESIKKNGLLQPILVRKIDDRYQIIAGERRWHACKNAGLKSIPVCIKEVADNDAIMLALVENVQRSDLNPIEEAYGYRRMMERGKMTQSEVAQAVSKGRSTIANALRLLELPEDAQQLLYEEKITAGHARAILSVPTAEGRKKLTEKLVEKQLSVRETESIARLLAGKKDKPQIKKEPAPKSYKTVARTLGDTLGTEVKIKSFKGKNKIEIEFRDEADLERLFRLIAHNK